MVTVDRFAPKTGNFTPWSGYSVTCRRTPARRPSGSAATGKPVYNTADGPAGAARSGSGSSNCAKHLGDDGFLLRRQAEWADDLFEFRIKQANSQSSGPRYV